MESRTARSLWLLVQREDGRTEVSTIHRDGGGQTLPIFSHREEAGLFLWLDAFGDEVMAGLVSLRREDFVRNFMDEHESRAPFQGSFETEAPADYGFSGSLGRRRV